MSVAEFRELCKQFALEQVELQKTDFKRLGLNADWNKPYVTLQEVFEAEQIRLFGDMAKKAISIKERSRSTGPLQVNHLLLKRKSNIRTKYPLLSMWHLTQKTAKVSWNRA